jgi:sporulation protein YlmC with PRC-barrel domain
MTSDAVGGPRHDAALDLLDRQLVDVDGRPMGKVDDLELVPAADGRLHVTALLTGPGALGPRLGGRLGEWTVATWRRLRADSGSRPARVPFGEVTDITAAVHLGRRDDGGTQGLERWLLEHVVRRLPGADAADEPHRAADAPGGDGRQEAPADDAHRLGELLGAPVVGADGASLGHVNDVRLGPAPGVTGVRAPLRTEGLIVSDRHAGSLLGYDRYRDQGPALVRAVVRRLHRDARYVPWEGVRRIDWHPARIEVDQRAARPLP